MYVNWKQVAKSEGYKSLKQAYIKYVLDSPHNKQEYLEDFNWAINRAKHYATKKNCSLEEILNSWEERRTYSWRNYYQDGNQPKLTPRRPSYRHRPKTLKADLAGGFKYPYAKRSIKKYRLELLVKADKKKSKKQGKKARWTVIRKNTQKYYNMVATNTLVTYEERIRFKKNKGL